MTNPSQAVSPEAIEGERLRLGQLLADLRGAAEFSQRQLAPLTGYSPSVVAAAERGRPHVAEQFWENADKVLSARDQLLTGYRHIESMRAALRDQERQRARAQRERRLAQWLQEHQVPERASHPAPPSEALAGGPAVAATYRCPHCQQPLSLVAELTASPIDRTDA